MKVLVTGVGGQLARSIAERWAGERDMQIVVAGRPDLDLEVPGSAAQRIAAEVPDLVVNTAAYTAVDEAEDELRRADRINADAAGEIAAAAHAAGARIVHLSTDYVFDGRSSAPYAEDAPIGPLNAYGRSKLAGEEQVRSAAPDHLIVRTAWLYSPFGRNFVRTMMNAARARATLRVVHDQRGCPTSALDLADGLLAAVRSWHGGSTYHFAGAGETSWCGFAAAIMEECRRRGLPAAKIAPIATADWPTRAERPRSSTLDCSKFERDFGFPMREWRRSLPTVVERLAGEV